MTALYTSATFIDELSTDPLETAGTATATLLCIVEEEKIRNDGKVRIGLVGELFSSAWLYYASDDDFSSM